MTKEKLETEIQQLTQELCHVHLIINSLESYIKIASSSWNVDVLSDIVYYKNMASDLYKKIASITKQIAYHSAKEYRKNE